MFLAIFQVIWHHLQVCQEHPCPPRLLLESWRTGRVLTDLYMSNHLEIYTQCFWPSFKSFNTISRGVKNINVLQDSCWSLGGQVESWLTSTCPIILKFIHNLSGHLSSHLTPSPVCQDHSCPPIILKFMHNKNRLFSKIPSQNMFYIYLEHPQLSRGWVQIFSAHSCHQFHTVIRFANQTAKKDRLNYFSSYAFAFWFILVL